MPWRVFGVSQLCKALGQLPATSCYLRQGGYIFTRVCLSVCLSVYLLMGYSKTTDQMIMKFCGLVLHNPGTNQLGLHSGGNPELDPDPGIFKRILPLWYCNGKGQGCGFGLDVSVSRQSRDSLRPRSRLGRIGKRLDLGSRVSSWYRSQTVRLRAQVIFCTCFTFTKCHNMDSATFTLNNPYRDADFYTIGQQYSFRPNQHTILKIIDLQANVVIILFCLLLVKYNFYKYKKKK